MANRCGTAIQLFILSQLLTSMHLSLDSFYLQGVYIQNLGTKKSSHFNLQINVF